MKNSKSEIRRLIRNIKKQLTSEEVQAYSESACTLLFSRLNNFQSSRIALFVSLKSEIQTDSLIHQLLEANRHEVLLPRVEGERVMRFYRYTGRKDELELSEMKIWEPKCPRSQALIPDIIILPGIAFDYQGGRVGQGGGFYDTYLSKFGDNIQRTIGFAYDFQLLQEKVPMSEHDKAIDELVTNLRHLIFNHSEDE